MRQANDEATLRAVQAVALNIAKIFAKICEENNLEYTLFLGSLLGAVRHKGFIPWDDDIDFAMPRESFERFIKIAPTKLPKRYRLRHFSQPNCHRYVARIEDTETLVRLKSYREGNDLPIWIDIFVLDGAFDSAVRRTLHNAAIKCKKGLWAISAFDEVVNLNRPGRPAYQQLIINACKVINPGSLMNTQARLKKLDKTVSRVDYSTSNSVFCASTAYEMPKATWHKEDFQKLRAFDFENTQFMGPKNYGRVLQTTYGDYMKLPPAEDRTLHQIELLTIPEDYISSKPPHSRPSTETE